MARNTRRAITPSAIDVDLAAVADPIFTLARKAEAVLAIEAAAVFGLLAAAAGAGGSGRFFARFARFARSARDATGARILRLPGVRSELCRVGRARRVARQCHDQSKTRAHTRQAG
jgi:hypothetical protein